MAKGQSTLTETEQQLDGIKARMYGELGILASWKGLGSNASNIFLERADADMRIIHQELGIIGQKLGRAGVTYVDSDTESQSYIQQGIDATDITASLRG